MEQPYTELEYNAASQQAGKWGFTVGLNEGANVTLLTHDAPAYMAQVWTLNLLAAKWQAPIGGAFNALIGTRQQPIDNATLPIGTVRLDYGVDSAMESVEFDYPLQGGTFQFHAATFRLYLGETGAFVPATIAGYSFPQVGGFVAPGSRGASAADVLPSCTLTTLLQTSVVTPGTFHWRPRRALAYRIVPFNVGGSAANYTVRQIGFNAGILTLDLDGALATPATPELMLNRNAFEPLIANAQGISVETVVAGAFYYVQWLLDIG